MKPCKIAVIVPVHNAAAFLTACTDAIAAQKFDGFRCILVEDGSTDDSPALCDAIAAGDQRFVALHQTNSGVCALNGVSMLYETSVRLCRHIRDRDLSAAVAWIDYCTRETVSGSRRIYY